MIYQTLAILKATALLIVQPDLSQNAVKASAVGAIEGVDVFLISMALYIIGIGLHSLFVDREVELPQWLKLEDLEDLKANLISVVIVVLAVLFLKEAVSWSGGNDILAFGAANGLVIGALAFFLIKGGRRNT